MEYKDKVEVDQEFQNINLSSCRELEAILGGRSGKTNKRDWKNM